MQWYRVVNTKRHSIVTQYFGEFIAFAIGAAIPLSMFAIGGNPEAARVSGVNVTLNLIGIYTLSGVFYAFGGLLEAGRIGSATNNLGFMYELDAIAACVIGGVSFSGGVGTVAGVVMGVIIFQLLNYGLSYIGVNPYWQYIIKGGIIVLAVAMDSMKNARRK